MLNKLLNWFRRPKWEEFRENLNKIDQTRYAPGTVVYLDEYGNPKHPGEQWRTNFSLTAAQRSERSRKAAATRKANKAKSNGE